MKTVVLFSGGQDSTVCLAWALSKYAGDVLALSVDYGQRHVSELKAAAEIAERLQAPHLVISMTTPSDSALVDTNKRINWNDDLPTSWVPGRNMLFISAALGLNPDRVVIGTNSEDFSGYPDCRPEFIGCVQSAAALALNKSVEVLAPLQNLKKSEICELGVALGVHDAVLLSKTCYMGVDCGECLSCRVRRRGFAEAGIRDKCYST